MSLENSVDQNNPRVQNVVRKGYLKKLKTLKKKFFVLKSDSKENSACLEYYDSEKKFNSKAQPKKVIPIKTCFNINRRLDTRHKHVIALYTKEEIFCVVLESEEELRDWLNDLFSFFQEGSAELIQPSQHVWQVNIQKRGLGGTNNILGFHNLCLTDKTLTLVKIRSKEIVTCGQEPETYEFSLKNIRRCGCSESFFYMEVGRLTKTGAGELWMHTDDANIAESMHSTIFAAMQMRARSMSASAAMKPTHLHVPETKGLCPGGICVVSCLKPCATSSGSYEIDPKKIADTLATRNVDEPAHYQTSNDSKIHNSTDAIATAIDCVDGEHSVNEDRTIAKIERNIKHIRTTSLPVGREEMDLVANQRDFALLIPKEALDVSILKSRLLDRRASTGGRLYKWSPSHPKNGSGIAASASSRVRADSVPARPQSNIDEIDSHPRVIPEEPDAPYGYLPMAPGPYFDATRRRLSPARSDGSVASGTPSTDLRFAEYHLEPVTAGIADEEHQEPIIRAYSVGSRPTRPPSDPRVRAFSVGSHSRPKPAAATSAPHLPPPTRVDPLTHMVMDFSDRGSSPRTRPHIVRSPPIGFSRNPFNRTLSNRLNDEQEQDGYVDMSPGSAYVDMQPEMSNSPVLGSTPDGYVEMSFGASSEVAVAAATAESELVVGSPEGSGSQTIFTLDTDSPADEGARLATVRENSEEGTSEYVSLTPTTPALNYAALDLIAPKSVRQPASHTYSQIDFKRSEKLNAIDTDTSFNTLTEQTSQN